MIDVCSVTIKTCDPRTYERHTEHRSSFPCWPKLRCFASMSAYMIWLVWKVRPLAYRTRVDFVINVTSLVLMILPYKTNAKHDDAYRSHFSTEQGYHEKLQRFSMFQRAIFSRYIPSFVKGDTIQKPNESFVQSASLLLVNDPTAIFSVQPSISQSSQESETISVIPSENPSYFASAIRSSVPSIAPSPIRSDSSASFPSFLSTYLTKNLSPIIPPITPLPRPPSFSQSSKPSDTIFPVTSSRYSSYFLLAIPFITQSSGLPSPISSDIPKTAPINFPLGISSNAPSGILSDVSSSSLTPIPSGVPSSPPSDVPSDFPSDAPIDFPSRIPSNAPSDIPSDSPSNSPIDLPLDIPSNAPSDFLIDIPSDIPSKPPSDIPSDFPSNAPTEFPSDISSVTSLNNPTYLPSSLPSILPTISLSAKPSEMNTIVPTTTVLEFPSNLTSSKPSATPTSTPSFMRTTAPTTTPSIFFPTSTALRSESSSYFYTTTPTGWPSFYLRKPPSSTPSLTPSTTPSATPSLTPSSTPSVTPSLTPSSTPSVTPSLTPSSTPSVTPSSTPSSTPSTRFSTTPSIIPSMNPLSTPSVNPSNDPSITLSGNPSIFFSMSPSFVPYVMPSTVPTIVQSNNPSDPLLNFNPPIFNSISDEPTLLPSVERTIQPTVTPTVHPIPTPTTYPTFIPTAYPTFIPTLSPSSIPTTFPSFSPSHVPSTIPSVTPTSGPTLSNFPSYTPSGFPTVTPTFSLPPTLSFEPSQDPTLSNRPSTSLIDDTVDELILEYVGFNSSNLLIIPTWENVTGNHIQLYLIEIDRIRIAYDVEILFKKWQFRSRAVQASYSRQRDEYFYVTCSVRVQYRTTSNEFDLRRALEDSFRASYSKSIYMSELQDALPDFFGSSARLVDVSVSDEDDEVAQNETISERLPNTHNSEDNELVRIVVPVFVSTILFACLCALFYALRRKKLERGQDKVNELNSSGEYSIQNEYIREILKIPSADNDEASSISLSEYPLTFLTANIIATDLNNSYVKFSAENCKDDIEEPSEHIMSRIYGNDTAPVFRICGSSDTSSSGDNHLFDVKERIEVLAPRGKLGVILGDCNNRGFPEVVTIKDGSMLTGIMKEGDRIISFNGEPTSKMTAIALSKRIKLAANDSLRKFIIVRGAVI